MTQKIKAKMDEDNYLEINIYNDQARRHILEALTDYAVKHSLDKPKLLEHSWVQVDS